MSTKTIRVLAVPEPAHDDIGQVNAVPYEGVPTRYVGAELDIDAMAKARGKARFSFSTQPVEVPFTAYYRRAVQDGHLEAADEATAKLCAVPWPSKAPAPAAAKVKAPKTPLAHADAWGDQKENG